MFLFVLYMDVVNISFFCVYICISDVRSKYNPGMSFTDLILGESLRAASGAGCVD